MEQLEKGNQISVIDQITSTIFVRESHFVVALFQQFGQLCESCIKLAGIFHARLLKHFPFSRRRENIQNRRQNLQVRKRMRREKGSLPLLRRPRWCPLKLV